MPSMGLRGDRDERRATASPAWWAGVARPSGDGRSPASAIVAQGDVRPRGRNRIRGHYTATIYPGPQGNFVWNGATIWWTTGLSSPPGYLLPRFGRTQPRGLDPRVQKITANLLAPGRRG